MTEDRNNPEAKRQEALERLRQRRGEARRAQPSQIQAADTEDSATRPFVRQRERRAEKAKLDVSVNQPVTSEPETDKARQLREAQRAKRRARRQLEQEGNNNEAIASLVGEDEKLIETLRQIQQTRRANRAKRNQQPPDLLEDAQPQTKRQRAADDPIYPTDLLRELQQQLLGEVEAALSATPLDQLEQRRKDLKYRYDWLQSLLEEMREELDRIQEHIIDRLMTAQPPTNS